MNDLILELKALSKKVSEYNKLNISANINPIIELSDEGNFMFRCEALHPGNYKGYEIEEMEIAMAKDSIFLNDGNFRNDEINKDHKGNRKMDSSVDDVVGRVVDSQYDFQKKALIITGEIYDKVIAEKIRKKLLKHVSLRINPKKVINENGKTYARGLIFEELSLVRIPGDDNAYIFEHN